MFLLQIGNFQKMFWQDFLNFYKNVLGVYTKDTEFISVIFQLCYQLYKSVHYKV